MADKNWLEKGFEWLGQISNIQTAAQLFAAFGVSNLVTSMLPGGWHQPQYWAVFGTVLFGTLLVLGVVVRAVKATNELFAQRSLAIDAHGGHKATLQLTHSGEPTTYTVQGRIVSMVKGERNMAPQTFDAELQPGGGKSGDFKVTLAAGEFAHVIVADIGVSDNAFGPSFTWLQVRRGKYASKTQVSDSGVVVEYSITSPQSPSGLGTRRYKVVREFRRGEDFVTIEEIPVG